MSIIDYILFNSTVIQWNKMSYFGFLDRASLFQLLLRLHYEDLWMLCSVKNYLYRIVCTQFFMKEWRTYNITLSNGCPVDRLGRKHGLCRTSDVVLGQTREVQYVKDIREGLSNVYTDGDYGRRIYTMYKGGLKHGLKTIMWDDGYVEHLSYNNGKKTGLHRGYNYDISIRWQEIVDGKSHGKAFLWDEFGCLRQINRYQNGKMKGRQIYFNSRGIKVKDLIK